MAAKFRGNSDDWLDSADHKDSGGQKRATRGKKHSRSASLPADQANATVAEVFPNQSRIRLDDSVTGVATREILCSYRRGELLGQSPVERERSPVAVGDRVRVDVSNPQSGVVIAACERRNRLVRHAPGRESRQLLHVVAANVDWLAIVASTVRPDFAPGLIDRFLVAAAAQGIRPVIVVTKLDLVTDVAARPWQLYVGLGIPVVEVVARQGTGLAGLRELVGSDTVVFCGHSGVGKTSLLRALTGREIGRVGEVSIATGKGQHTTTSAVLLGGTSWIDTPGIREFGLVGIEPAELTSFFPDLGAMPCETPGCLHDGEPGCAASGLPRHTSYLRILESLREDAGQ